MTLTRRAVLQRGSIGASLAAMAAACGSSDQDFSDDLADLDAVETTARIREGALSAREAVEAAIMRAERVEPQINAIVTKTFNEARKAADQATGPYAGVPTFVKDLDDVAGVKTRFGSRAMRFYKTQAQSAFVNQFLASGVVSLGKSSTPEFGLSGTTEPISGGATRNPWNTDHSTGGSSGGAAALVAAGVVPVAHASDGGGSIRIPASCCGVVGLKMTRGRHPIARPSFGPIDLSVHGVESRTVRDTAAFAAALSRADGDMAPLGLITEASTRRLRIAVMRDSGLGLPIDPEVIEATERVAARCAELGHEIVDAPSQSSTTNAEYVSDFQLYWAAAANAIVTAWEAVSPFPAGERAFEPFTLGLVEHFRKNEARYNDTVRRLQLVPDMVDEGFDNFDVVLSPVVASPPPAIGHLGGELDYDTLIGRLTEYVQFTALYNVSGAPAISLPLSMSSNGLPIGAMFAAKRGQDQTLIELAYELEEAMAWRDRKPAIFG